jgi:hypothetical protein
VLGYLSRNAHHIGGFPRKHVEVLFEEVDECAFLFRIEHHPDTECATIVGDGHIPDIFGGLKRAGRSRLDDSGISGSSEGGSALSLSVWMSVIEN